MNAKSAAASVSAAVVPGAVVLGAGLLVSAIAGLQAQRDHYRAEATGPRPTATVTTRTEVRTTVVAQPPAATRATERFPPSAAGRTGGEQVTASRPPLGAGAPSGPKPTPTGGSSSALLSAHLPLVDLTVGGHR